MKKIQLKPNVFAIVDDDDFENVSKHKWTGSFIAGNWRVTARINNKNVPLSRFIMNANSDLLVDHKNLDTLDNRKENLRFATKQENGRNRRSQKNNKLGYKGVCWDRNRFKARIYVDGKHILLGRFENVIEAAKAYDEAAKEIFRDFARLNFEN